MEAVPLETVTLDSRAVGELQRLLDQSIGIECRMKARQIQIDVEAHGHTAFSQAGSPKEPQRLTLVVIALDRIRLDRRPIGNLAGASSRQGRRTTVSSARNSPATM